MCSTGLSRHEGQNKWTKWDKHHIFSLYLQQIDLRGIKTNKPNDLLGTKRKIKKGHFINNITDKMNSKTYAKKKPKQKTNSETKTKQKKETNNNKICHIVISFLVCKSRFCNVYQKQLP